MTWLGTETEGATSLDRIFGLTPEIYATFRDLYGAVWDADRGDPALLELCRLRVAQLVGCPSELAARTGPAAAAGLTDEKVAELRQWPTSPLYDDRDRAVLNFAERYVIDASSISDTDCARLREHLSDPECATLTTALAMFDAMARFRVALGVEPPADGEVHVVPIDPAVRPTSLP